MESSYLWINDLRVHYYHWGMQDGGRPVVLLHGLASNARIWEKVAPRLAETGLMPLAPDGRGHGLTDKPGGDYGFETFRRDLLAFLEATNVESPVLVGHSWGASLALYFAARMSLGPRAPAGLILVDGGMTQLDDLPGATWESTEKRLTPPRLAGMPLQEFLKLLKEHTGWKMDDTSLSIILSNFDIREDGEEEGETIWPRLTFENHMQIVRAMWEQKTYELFRQVRCPVVMIPSRTAAESRDPNSYLKAKERGIQKAQETIKQLQVHWMEDTIHDSPLQRPEQLATWIADFAHGLDGA